MSGKLVDTPPTYIKERNPAVYAGFSAMRAAAFKAGPLDERTCEYVLLGAFATAGYEMPFKNHARKLHEAGLPKEALQQVVFLTFGSTATVNQVALALSWIDDIYR